MSWESLNLWADEERKIHECLIEALKRLIDLRVISGDHKEKFISGKLRPLLRQVKKSKKLTWTLNPEASSFAQEDDAEPSGHPDIRFSQVDSNYDDYHYDVECKLVRLKRGDKDTDYCYNYVKHGVLRYQTGVYAQSWPPMGAMLGYVQEGELTVLLNLVNDKARNQSLKEIKPNGTLISNSVTHLTQPLQRTKDSFTLTHLWADLRNVN